MNDLNLKQFDKGDLNNIEGKKLFLISFFPSYVSELYERYGYKGEIAGVFDPDEKKHGEKGAAGHKFTVRGMKEIHTCPEKSVLMITTGYFEEVFDELKSMSVPETIDRNIYFLANKDTEYYLSYHKELKQQPLRDIMVFRSSTGTWEYVPGMDYTDNAKALFEYLLMHGFNRKYKLVWLVKDPSLYRDIEETNENVSFISFDWAVTDDECNRRIYYENICLAKYFFFTQASAFCRLKREGQTRIQLWHGCGPKIERIPVREEHHYEFRVVTSDYFADFHSSAFGLRGDQMMVTGLPKNDWLFHPLDNWRNLLEIPEGDKYVFWLPTFRNTYSVLNRLNTNIDSGIDDLQLFDNENMLAEMDEWLSEKRIILVIKQHPLQRSINPSERRYRNIVFLDNSQLDRNRLHINEILGNADALISDYSSVSVDYLLTGRPIGFVTADIEQYDKSRGLYKNKTESFFPGEMINSVDDMKRFLMHIVEGRDDMKDMREKSTELLHKYTDDRSCERILSILGI